MYSENFLKKLYKTIKQFISSNLLGLFYTKGIQRVLGHSRGTKRYLSTKRAVEGNCKDTTRPFGHSRHQGTRTQALRHSKDTRAPKHYRYEDTWALKNLGTLALEGRMGTKALRHVLVNGQKKKMVK